MEQKKFKISLVHNFVVYTIMTLLITLIGQMVGGMMFSLPVGIKAGRELAAQGATLADIDPEVIAQAVGGIQFSPFLDTFLRYFETIGPWIAFLLFFLLKRNKPLFKTITPACKGNNLVNLLLGLLIGFGLNGIVILAAALHGDISLSFDSFHPLQLLAILFAVFVQSSSEEVACRGYLYQKLLHRYKLPVVAVVGNALLFSFLHIFNSGVTALALLNILLSGLMFSLMVYYFDSMWMAFAAHCGWNFTQNIIFGLPNSGIRVPFSIMVLDEANARDSFAYNVAFGVEGTVLAVVVLAVACIVIYLIGRKNGPKATDIWAEYDAQLAAEAEAKAAATAPVVEAKTAEAVEE